jgi:hypothetical protein
VGEDRPEQHLVQLHDGPTQPLLQRLDRSGGSDTGAADEHGLRVVGEMAGDPLDDGARFDAAEVVRKIGRLRGDDLESLAAEVRRPQVVQLLVEPRRMDQRHAPYVEGLQRGAD